MCILYPKSRYKFNVEYLCFKEHTSIRNQLLLELSMLFMHFNDNVSFERVMRECKQFQNNDTLRKISQQRN